LQISVTAILNVPAYGGSSGFRQMKKDLNGGNRIDAWGVSQPKKLFAGPYSASGERHSQEAS